VSGGARVPQAGRAAGRPRAPAAAGSGMVRPVLFLAPMRARSATPLATTPARLPGRGLLLLALAAAACGDGGSSDSAAADGDRASPDRGRPADGVYVRELTFLASEGRRALVLAARAELLDGGGVVTMDAWIDAGDGWEPVMGASRSFAELRDPWRLFPLEGARLSVEDDGALRALTLSTPRGTLRLLPTSPPADLGAGSARVVLREAQLLTPGDSIRGVVVDGTLAFQPSDTTGPALIGVLTATGGPVVVLAGSDRGGPLLLADIGADDMLATPVRLEAGAVGGEWRIASEDESVSGTLRAIAAPPGDASGAPVPVSGRLALAGTLYPLAGVLRAPVP